MDDRRELMTTTDPLIGKQLGNYAIQALLGHGGMARVYKGYDPVLQRYAAIKVIDSHLVTGREADEYRQRFLREARSIARLSHPNIVTIYDYNADDNINYMVMAFIEGQDLRHIVRAHVEKRQRLPYASTLRIIRDTADALDYAHEAGVIHRDVKPSNIMVSTHGRAVLTDFGLALNLTEGTMGNTFGSVHYIAPEQAISSDKAVAQSDLYSLGVVLFEMLTGQVPFDDPQPMSVAMQHLNNPPPPPRSINPDLPEEAESVILKAMEKEPEDRYATGAELVEALENALVAGGAVPQARVSKPPSWKNADESWGTVPYSDREEDQGSDTPPYKPETPLDKSYLPGDPTDKAADSDSRLHSASQPLSRPSPPPSWMRKENSGANASSSIPVTPQSSAQQRRRPNFLIMGAGVLLIAAALVLVFLTVNNGGKTGGDNGGTAIAVIGTDEATFPVNEETEAATRPVIAAPTTVTPTSMATSGSATRRPTNTPTADRTATAVAMIPTNTPVPPENSVLLRYDADSLTAYNHTNSDVDLSNLTFLSEDEAGDTLLFDSDVWVGSSPEAGVLKAGYCFMVWRNVLSELDPPNYCVDKDAWWAVGAPRWFWIADDPQTTFEVRRGTEVLATCTIGDGECLLRLG